VLKDLDAAHEWTRRALALVGSESELARLTLSAEDGTAAGRGRGLLPSANREVDALNRRLERIELRRERKTLRTTGKGKS